MIREAQTHCSMKISAESVTNRALQSLSCGERQVWEILVQSHRRNKHSQELLRKVLELPCCALDDDVILMAQTEKVLIWVTVQ
jgi:hypothetical protein